jgi:hypothetical protein
VDLRHRKGADLSLPAVQAKWLRRIDSGGVDALLVTPPCSTFSRASWANDEGPIPLRSSRCPRGFTWNSKARRQKAELGNILHWGVSSGGRKLASWNSQRTWANQRTRESQAIVRPQCGNSRSMQSWLQWRVCRVLP